jgi:hypothetical protein
MLVRYFAALDITVDDPDTYGSAATVIKLHVRHDSTR